MLYVYQAEVWCDDCGETIARTVKAPDAFTCRERGCGAKLTLAQVPDWPNGSVNPECWYDCPECGSGKVALDDSLYDSDEYPKGDPNSEYEQNSCGSGADCPNYEPPDEDEESDEDEN